MKPKAGLADRELAALLASVGAKEEGAIPQIDVHILRVPEDALDKVIEALSHNPKIEFAEPDLLHEPALVPNDPLYSSAWHLPKIGAPAAWDISTGNNGVTIAILDSGIDGTHPDLAPLLVAGWNFYDNNADVSDVTGHGTAVAGSAVALSNNGLGVAGIAWSCRLMPLRIADANGNASSSATASALTWAADHGARVANISYGNVTKATAIDSAAQYFQSKGGVVAASAGNSAIFDTTVENPHFLLVSATDSNDALASWSNTGNNVDLAAPGVNIATTMRGGGYGNGSGTSFSSPIVAGVAALVLSVKPSLSAQNVSDILKQSADDLGATGWDTSFGAGRVNAARAVQLAANFTPPPTADTVAPTVSLTAPASGAVLTGVVQVGVAGKDDVGVTMVGIYLDGVLADSAAGATATFTWNTTSVADGTHTLQPVAKDAAGNVGTSTPVSVSVKNAADTSKPVVWIASPSSGSTIGRTVNVAVSASDNVSVKSVELYVDGARVGSVLGTSATFSLNCNKWTRGSHTLSAAAYDGAGNSAVSQPVTVYK